MLHLLRLLIINNKVRCSIGGGVENRFPNNTMYSMGPTCVFTRVLPTIHSILPNDKMLGAFRDATVTVNVILHKRPYYFSASYIIVRIRVRNTFINVHLKFVRPKYQKCSFSYVLIASSEHSWHSNSCTFPPGIVKKFNHCSPSSFLTIVKKVRNLIKRHEDCVFCVYPYFPDPLAIYCDGMMIS